MRQFFVSTAVLWMGVGMSAPAQTVVDFEKDKPGSPPAGLWTKADSVIRFDDLRIVREGRAPD